MNSTPYLSRIRIYPFKSLDPIELDQAEIGTASLLHDRAYAMLGADGNFINGKRTGRVNELKAQYDLSKSLVHLSPRAGGVINTFHFEADRKNLETYLTAFFGSSVHLVSNTEGELMDIPAVSGITVVSESSLQSLQKDFPTHSLDDLRLRFRFNLELAGAESFWEEQLFGEPGEGVEFTIGEATFIGMSPRARCNVPPRDPFTGSTDKSFIRTMMKSRAGSLPPNSKLLRHGSLYQLTVNTFVPETQKGKIIRVGDALTIRKSVQFEL